MKKSIHTSCSSQCIARGWSFRVWGIGSEIKSVSAGVLAERFDTLTALKVR